MSDLLIELFVANALGNVRLVSEVQVRSLNRVSGLPEFSLPGIPVVLFSADMFQKPVGVADATAGKAPSQSLRRDISSSLDGATLPVSTWFL